VSAAPACDVLIAGCGPVGALLANALGRRGLRVRVCEREASIFDLPRAVHLDAEALRVLQGCGLDAAVLPCTLPTRGMEFVDSGGERYFGTVPRGSPPVETQLGWCRGYMFYQPDLERVLREGARRFPSVELRLRAEVESIEQDGAGVEARVRDLEQGRSERLRARYLVGCDGAHSGARRAIGAGLESLGYDRRWLVVDVFLRGEVALPGMSQQICDPARKITFIHAAGGHRRWEFELLPDESAEEMERPETVARLLSRWLAPGDAEIRRASVYAFHGVVATRWRDRRVLLAGDAAHQMPPFQGQGLCAGIRDVANLAWKLAFALDGRARDTLLDSYEAERAPHARALVESSIGVGRLMDRLADAEARGERFQDPALEANATRRAGWMPRLRGGLLPETPEGEAGPTGELLVQPRVRVRGGPPQRLDDALGDGFAVVAREHAEKLLPAQTRAWLERIGARWLAAGEWQDLDGWLDPLLERHLALLIRPDRYVQGAADDAPALERLLDQLRRALG
jgi:3-(3-hydroxy-phenyl)propionate hydroxylase